jgi:hypothetical protein
MIASSKITVRLIQTTREVKMGVEILPRARRHMLVAEEVDRELIIYDQRTHRAYNLNPTTAMVWRNLDRQMTIEELTKILRRDLTEAADEHLVWASVSELEKAQLLEGETGRSVDDERISRRQMVRRLGLVGATSLLIPVVSSIVVPDAAAASSPCSCSACVAPECCGSS